MKAARGGLEIENTNPSQFICTIKPMIYMYDDVTFFASSIQ